MHHIHFELYSPVIEEVLELVHPDLGHADVVVPDLLSLDLNWTMLPGYLKNSLNLASLITDLVRGERPEDVPDARAGCDLNAAPAHPRLERHLEVLAAPDLHSCKTELWGNNSEV